MLKVSTGKKGTISARIKRAGSDNWDSIGVIASTSKWWNFKNFIKKQVLKLISKKETNN